MDFEYLTEFLKSEVLHIIVISNLNRPTRKAENQLS